MRWRRFGAVVCLVVLWAPLVTVVMVVAHEVGHTVVARLLGDARATFILYRHAAIDLRPWSFSLCR